MKRGPGQAWGGFVAIVALFVAGLATVRGAEWFDPAILHDVRVTMPAPEWESLRRDAPDILVQIGPHRTNQARVRPYSQHRASLEFDGKPWPDVAVRKRGFVGSVSRERPSLNIQFPEAPGEVGPGGFRRVTLANTQQDASGIQLSLANSLFRAMGVPAPRTALARVTVNGEALGVYTLVEPVDREFLKSHFDGKTGPLWEGALADLRPEWIPLFETKQGTKASDTGVLSELAGLLAAEVVDWGRVGALVDLDAFLTFWAAEVLVDHWDGYANNQNNFFLHRRASDGRLVFLPWGADQCLGSQNPFTPRGAPPSVRATGLLARRLYSDAEWRERYRRRVGDLLEKAWDEPRWLGEIDRLNTLVGTNAWPGVTGRKQVLQRTREFVRRRKQALKSDLAGAAPEWKFPARTNTFLQPWGRVTASFETAFRPRMPIDWFTNGTVDLRLELDGQVQASSKVGVSVSRGFEPKQTNKVTVTFLGMNGITALRLNTVQVLNEDYLRGGDVAVDFYNGQGFFFEGMPVAGESGAGVLIGTLRLEPSGLAEGAPVKGRLEAEVWKFPR